MRICWETVTVVQAFWVLSAGLNHSFLAKVHGTIPVHSSISQMSMMRLREFKPTKFIQLLVVGAGCFIMAFTDSWRRMIYEPIIYYLLINTGDDKMEKR